MHLHTNWNVNELDLIACKNYSRITHTHKLKLVLIRQKKNEQKTNLIVCKKYKKRHS